MNSTSKQQTKRQRKAQQKLQLQQGGGLITVSFTFGGKKHTESHRLTPGEVGESERMLKQYGPQALEDSTLVQVAVTSGRLLGAHVITEAFKTFIRENWVPGENMPTAQDVIEKMAKRRGIILNKTQLDAVDDTAGLEPTNPLVGTEAIATIEYKEDGNVKQKDLQLIIDDAKSHAEEMTNLPHTDHARKENPDANPQRIPTI